MGYLEIIALEFDVKVHREWGMFVSKWKSDWEKKTIKFRKS